MPVITLLTDYGLKDSYVAEMKGARAYEVGPVLFKNKLRKELSPEEARKELKAIHSLIEGIADNEKAIANDKLIARART